MTLLLGAALLILSAQQGAVTITAGSVAAQIESEGSAATLSAVYDNPLVWPQVFDGVSSGDEAWLAVALKLRTASDAGASEDLDQSLAEALVQSYCQVLWMGAHDQAAFPFRSLAFFSLS